MRHKLFAAAFLALVFLLFLSLLSGMVFRGRIDALEKAGAAANSKTIAINWKEIYPFDSGTAESLPVSKTGNGTSIADKISGLLKMCGNLGTSLAGKMYKSEEISQAGCILHSVLADPSVGEEYIRLKNGYWIDTSKSVISPETAAENVSCYADLQNELKSRNIGFLYFYTPAKECAGDPQLPDGAVSYANENIDTTLSAMSKLGISFVDMRKSLHDDKLDHYSLFYKTDHHWNIDAGFWAASKIAEELNSRFGLRMKDVRQAGTFSRVTYKGAMFGSEGQGVTHFNAQSEDFDLLFPDFENRFTLEIPDRGINTAGSFADIFINYDGLESAIAEGGGYAYEKILYGNRPFVKIVNCDNPDGPRILMLRDSFSIAAAPYLAFSCSELVLLDCRSGGGNFTGSILNCIDRFKPDAVLVLQSSPHSIRLR